MIARTILSIRRCNYAVLERTSHIVVVYPSARTFATGRGGDDYCMVIFVYFFSLFKRVRAATAAAVAAA